MRSKYLYMIDLSDKCKKISGKTTGTDKRVNQDHNLLFSGTH